MFLLNKCFKYPILKYAVKQFKNMLCESVWQLQANRRVQLQLKTNRINCSKVPNRLQGMFLRCSGYCCNLQEGLLRCSVCAATCRKVYCNAVGYAANCLGIYFLELAVWPLGAVWRISDTIYFLLTNLSEFTLKLIQTSFSSLSFKFCADSSVIFTEMGMPISTITSFP